MTWEQLEKLKALLNICEAYDKGGKGLSNVQIQEALRILIQVTVDGFYSKLD